MKKKIALKIKKIIFNFNLVEKDEVGNDALSTEQRIFNEAL